MKHYDVVVIGGGSAGYVSAIKAAQLGKQVALVERDLLGGTCLNRGCIPTKMLLHVAEIFHQQKDYSLLGIEGQLQINAEMMNQRKNTVIEQLRSGIASLLQANQIEVIHETARLLNANQIQVGDDILSTTNILLATGSSVSKPPIPGIEYAYTSDDILQFSDKLFEDVVIIGGGVIGIEFASLYQQLGKKVTVLEAQDRILNVFDKEISQNLNMILKRRGVSIQCQSLVKEIKKIDFDDVNDSNQDINSISSKKPTNSFEVVYEAKGQEQKVLTQAVIVATGRQANGVDSDIELDYEKSRLKVNENYQTNIPNIYAVGDVSSLIQLAHLASHQGIHAISHMFGETLQNHTTIPMCVYTSPEIASVGMTEQIAKEQGISILVGKYMTLGNGKTMIANQDRGFVKVIVDEASKKVLGAQLMCDRASDMIAQLEQAIRADLTIDELQDTIYPHPSFSEAIHEALLDVTKKAIHVMAKKR